jgi:hypothetical protein
MRNEGWFQVKEWNNESNSKIIGEALYGKDGAWSNQKTQLCLVKEKIPLSQP